MHCSDAVSDQRNASVSGPAAKPKPSPSLILKMTISTVVVSMPMRRSSVQVMPQPAPIKSISQVDLPLMKRKATQGPLRLTAERGAPCARLMS